LSWYFDVVGCKTETSDVEVVSRRDVKRQCRADLTSVWKMFEDEGFGRRSVSIRDNQQSRYAKTERTLAIFLVKSIMHREHALEAR